MQYPLLSIAIPTYNRARFLDALLDGLTRDLETLEDVELVVCDNASTDDTGAVIARHQSSFPRLRVYRQSSNIGMDGNFRSCFEHASGRYLWMAGDDDLPRPGLLPLVIAALREREPDVLFLRSNWSNETLSGPRSLPESIGVEQMTRAAFVSAVHVWITYITAMVVRVDKLRPGFAFDSRYEGSKLTQLAWIAPAVLNGERFLRTSDGVIDALADNSGGYGLFEVFGRRLAEIVEREWSPAPKLYRTLLAKTAATYIPALLWRQRVGKNHGFDSDETLAPLACYRGFVAYWLMIVPMARLPLPLALPIAALCRILRAVEKVAASNALCRRPIYRVGKLQTARSPHR